MNKQNNNRSQGPKPFSYRFSETVNLTCDRNRPELVGYVVKGLKAGKVLDDAPDGEVTAYVGDNRTHSTPKAILTFLLTSGLTNGHRPVNVLTPAYDKDAGMLNFLQGDQPIFTLRTRVPAPALLRPMVEAFAEMVGVPHQDVQKMLGAGNGNGKSKQAAAEHVDEGPVAPKLSYRLLSDDPILAAQISADQPGAVAWTIRINAGLNETPEGVAGGTGEHAEAFVQLKYGTIFDACFTTADGTEVHSELGAFDDQQGAAPAVKPVDGVHVYATLVAENVVGTAFCHGMVGWSVSDNKKVVLAAGKGPLAQFSFKATTGEYKVSFSKNGKKVDSEEIFTVANVAVAEAAQ